MNKLKTTKVSTLLGTALLLVAIMPITAYTFKFKAEDAKLQNGIQTSPQLIVNVK